MRLPQPGRVLRLVLLPLLCLMAADICHARPQEQSTSAGTDVEITSSPITPSVRQLGNEDTFFASGAWRPVVSRTSPITEHQLHTDQERRRYNKDIWASKATDPRTSSNSSTVDYPLLNSTHEQNFLSFAPEQRVGRNFSFTRDGNRKGIYLRAQTRRSVNATQSPLFLKNESSSFNWKQRLQIPAATRIVLSKILNSFNGSSDSYNKSITPHEKGGSKPKRMHFLPVGLFSALSRNTQNISSQIHKILLNRLRNKTSTSELHENSTGLNKIKGSVSLAVGDEQFWSPVALTSNRLPANESFEGSLDFRDNSSKKVGGTKKYSVLTSFDNTHEANNGTYLVYTKGNTSTAPNTLKATNRLKSNSSKTSDATSWIPILQPAKGDSKLLNSSILAEPENSTTDNAINTGDTGDTQLGSPDTTNAPKILLMFKQNNSIYTGMKTSKVSDTFPDDVKLVNTFLANNMQDMRIQNNKGLEKVETANYSGTVPLPETKRWPGGTSGIQSLDDLILYHTYTNGLKEKPQPTAWTPQVSPNGPTVTMHQQPGGGYVGIIKKPAVTIHNSHWGHESSTPPPDEDQNPSPPSKPTIIFANKPHISKPVSNIHYPNHKPTYGEHKPEHGSSKPPPPALYPVVLITPRPTPAHKPSTPLYHYPSTHVHVTTPHPFSPSSPKPSNCPNILITTNGNFTATNKEGCPDVNILITSGVTNNNVVVSGPSTTTEYPVTSSSASNSGGAVITRPGLSQTGNGILSSITSAVSSVLNPLQYPFLFLMIAPVMIIVAGGIGIAALLFPWTVGWRRSGRKRRLGKKTTPYPKPKPRRRRSAHYFAYLPEEIVCEAYTEFEPNLSTIGVWKRSDILTSASSGLKVGTTRRRKRNNSLINYYWWWLKSDT